MQVLFDKLSSSSKSTQHPMQHLKQLQVALLLILACMMAYTAADDDRQAYPVLRTGPVRPADLKSSAAKQDARAPAKPSAQLQDFLTRYYRGQLPREKLAAAKAAMAATAAAADGVSTVSSSNYSWADPSWGQYRELTVVPLEGTPGLPIWGWDAMIPQEALDVAARVLGNMLGQLQDDIAKRLLNFPGVKVALFNRPEQKAINIPEHSIFQEFRPLAGLGGTMDIPVTSCDIENVLETDWDPYYIESILVHEFAHAIHLIGMSDCERGAVRVAYTSAQASGAYNSDMYMITNEAEYWACATQGWFEASRRSDVAEGIVSRSRLWAHDPTLFRLFRYVFKSSVVHYNYSSDCPRCKDKWPAESSVSFSHNKAAPMLPVSASGLSSCAIPLPNTTTNPNPPTPNISRPGRLIPTLPGDCRDTAAASVCESLVNSAPSNGCQARRFYAMRSCRNTCFCAHMCKDMRGTCREEAIAGRCGSDPSMLVECMQSCGMCYQTSWPAGGARAAASGSTRARDCKDNNVMCYIGANVHGNCTQEAFKADCPFSCGMCS